MTNPSLEVRAADLVHALVVEILRDAPGHGLDDPGPLNPRAVAAASEQAATALIAAAIRNLIDHAVTGPDLGPVHRAGEMFRTTYWHAVRLARRDGFLRPDQYVRLVEAFGAPPRTPLSLRTPAHGETRANRSV